MEWAKLLSTEKLSSEPPEPDSFKEYLLRQLQAGLPKRPNRHGIF